MEDGEEEGSHAGLHVYCSAVSGKQSNDNWSNFGQLINILQNPQAFIKVLMIAVFGQSYECFTISNHSGFQGHEKNMPPGEIGRALRKCFFLLNLLNLFLL